MAVSFLWYTSFKDIQKHLRWRFNFLIQKSKNYQCNKQYLRTFGPMLRNYCIIEVTIKASCLLYKKSSSFFRMLKGTKSFSTFFKASELIFPDFLTKKPNCGKSSEASWLNDWQELNCCFLWFRKELLLLRIIFMVCIRISNWVCIP